ncbi:hypothetical protein CDD82_1566 [Ophiocordyceps australis]|uniref:Only prolin and serin are matching in the corresponding protein n=1 Tax=Ophiocordyceps australis TaxID=1399860 RepID=A0A2C5XLD1_9HYPO|nr:hypothetical protein CDD82_1566 [Ophiocordyceps australis]
MSPKLKPLLLPQIVERRRQVDALSTDNGDVSQVYFTTNSSCSDVTSPLTPTFSAPAHQRLSSSSSSLELPPQAYDTPSSPPQLLAVKPDKTPLPDVEEERYDDDDDAASEYFGLYSCLCDNVCPHRNSADHCFFPESVPDDSEIDYDMGFLSDGDLSADLRLPKKRAMVDSSPFAALTSRLGSRLPTMKRWRSHKRNGSKPTPLSDANFANDMSREPSSRSSSISGSNHHMTESRVNAFATAPSSISCLSSDDNLCMSPLVSMTPEEHSNLEVERSMATTPLLPPLLTDPLQKPPPESPIESPLQSPTVAPPSAATLISGPSSITPRSSRPPLSSRPSLTSLRQMSSGTDLPLSLPSIMQDHDEWSDRLGHANFTITPVPYQPDSITTETVQKFLSHRNLASSNYAKHLLRVKEHYGHTSMIYAMTEMKWEETQAKWKSIYQAIFTQNSRSAPASTNHSRNHSRGRGRGRSNSSVAAVDHLDSNHDYLADVEWRRIDDCHPGAVPRMLESLNVHGKFPCRGEEDIVGLMERETVMIRARSEDAKGRFWRSIVDKVGLRK